MDAITHIERLRDNIKKDIRLFKNRSEYLKKKNSTFHGNAIHNWNANIFAKEMELQDINDLLQTIQKGN